MLFYIVYFAVCVIFAMIGSSMARSRNRDAAIWGLICFFTNLVGIIVLAIAGNDTSRASSYSSSHPILPDQSDWRESSRGISQRSVDKPVVSKRYDEKRWRTLIEVDPEIAKAVEEVAPYGNDYLDQLAEKYLILNDKTYLHSIIEKVIASAIEDAAKAQLQVSDSTAATSQYMAWVQQNNGMDRVYRKKVARVLAYRGSSDRYRDGIKILFDDGSVALQGAKGSEIFKSEQDADLI